MNQTQLLTALITVLPDGKNLYSDHLQTYDGLLPHVLMADIAREAQRLNRATRGGDRNSEQTLTALLDVLERAMAGDVLETRELIIASFLENIPRDQNGLLELEGRFGKSMAFASRRMREWRPKRS